MELSNFGIICVTRESANAAWMLFEAGALAKSLQGSRVIPLLLDLDFREISGPLAQFQAKKVDSKGLWEVAQSINDASSQSIPGDRLKQLFDALWPQFEKLITAIPSHPSPAKHTRPQAEVLEELVAAVRSLDLRFREGGPRVVSQRRRKDERHFFETLELSSQLEDLSAGPVGLLILASLFDEDAPWIYELAAEAYRLDRRGNRREAFGVVRTLLIATDLMSRRSLFNNTHREAPRQLMRQLDRLHRAHRTRPSQASTQSVNRTESDQTPSDIKGPGPDSQEKWTTPVNPFSPRSPRPLTYAT